MSFLRHYLIALSLFTRVPVSGPLARSASFTPDMLRASAAHFPGVGWLVGIVACVAFALLGLTLPESDVTGLAAAVGSTIATVLLTGGSHETALAHTADGLGGGATPERALEIMGDSRLGAFGAMALALVLLAKVSMLALLAARSPVAVLSALLAAHVLSRFWPLLLLRGMPRVGDVGSSDGAPLAERIGSRDLAIAAAWCAVALATAVLAQGMVFVIAGLAASAVALLWMQRLLARRLKGLTGKGLGATQQVCEIAFYLGAAMALGGT
ncbi:MAG TPA: adenosylcobinamide-GDP ribazoletransferase [Ramlibacter sp.]|nr:adenosylcobinamide-GDP ribazoletransferase [Ramlibacter sp.]